MPSDAPSATTVVVAAATAAAAATALTAVAARRRAAAVERASAPSSAFASSASAAAARWNAQNPSPVFQLAVFYADAETGEPSGPAALVMHPRRGALADLASAVAAAAPSPPPAPLLLLLSLSGTGAGPFVELAPAKEPRSASVDPDAAALGAIEEATSSAKRVAVVYAVAAAAAAAVAQKLAAHRGLRPVPSAPGGLPVLGHAILAARGPFMQPTYNLAHHLFLAPAKASAEAAAAGVAAPLPPPAIVRLRLPGMGPPAGVSPASCAGPGDDPDAWRTVVMTRDPRVVAELLAHEELWPKKFDRPPQALLRDFAGPGLFTSSSDEPDWVTAHGVLPKLFNALRVTAMFPAVMTKTRAFVARWAALPLTAAPSSSSSGSSSSPSPPFAVVDHASDWLTSMTIDAVVLAAVGTDMKNVERLAEGRPLHPFITNFRYGLGYAVGNVSVAGEFGRAAAANPFFDGKGALKRRYLESKAACEEIVAGFVEQTRGGELTGAGGAPNVIAAMMADRSTADGSLVPVTSFYGHMINIMIAGHETTAATLGFTLAHLSVNPDCERKVLEELDRVLGVDVEGGAGAGAGAGAASSPPPQRAIREPAAADIGRLPYLEACFREALRLHPAVTATTRDAARDTVLLGEHALPRGQRVQVNLVALHRHEDHWSGGGLKPVDEYDPERFMPPHAAKRHPCAFGGFGFGSRACIGSQFALLEAKTFLAVLLPRFVIRAAGAATASDPAPPYPHPPPASLADGGAAPTAHGLRLRVHPRPGFVAAPPPQAAAAASVPAAAGGRGASASSSAGGGENLRASGTSIPSTPATPRGSVTGAGAAAAAAAAPSAASGAAPPVPFHVLFGSNSGTCEALASRVAEVAAAAGFAPVRLTALDAAHTAIKADGGSGSMPTRAAVAVVCSTYNGTPPDNARAFLKWAQEGAVASPSPSPSPAAAGRIPPGVGYCVVGLGNSQWAATYQKVPRALDESLEGFGATRVRAFNGIDVNEPDFVDVFEGWLATLGSEMRVHFGLEEGGAAAAGGGADGAAAAAAGGDDDAAPAPTLASLAPAPRFSLETLPFTTSSPGLADALAARGLAPDGGGGKGGKGGQGQGAPGVCLDIAAVSRALLQGRRRLAGAGSPSNPYVGSEPYHILRVLRNEELQGPGSDRSTRHVELELPSPSDADRFGAVPAAGDDAKKCDPSRYEAGDHLELLACNAPALVDGALRALGLAGDEVVVWSPALGRSARGVGAVDSSTGGAAAAAAAAAGGADGAAADAAARPLAIATTTRMLMAWVADLGAPPSRRLVEALVGACACPPERRAARDKFCSPNGYKQNVLLARLTVAELLAAPEMRSAPAPPMDALLLALPRVAPRYYSISSSPLASEGKPSRTCSVTVGLVRFPTGTGRVHEGACSSLVHRTPALPLGAAGGGAAGGAEGGGGVLLGTVRRLQSTFRLPSDPTAPIIMIGPGTGVAPMMGFLQERHVLQASKGAKLGAAHLFFGCRSDADYIYRETLEGYAASGVLTGLHVAYSRKEGVPKTYVQSLIEEKGAELWRLLSSRADGRVYVCGDARRMAPDVKAAFRELAVRHGGRSQAAADAWIGSMLEGARYLEDVWAGA